jgi:hypothetical protein
MVGKNEVRIESESHFISLSFYVICILVYYFVLFKYEFNQHYALLCITLLFYILAPKCFGSSLPSSGSFLDPSELLEMQIESYNV